MSMTRMCSAGLLALALGACGDRAPTDPPMYPGEARPSTPATSSAPDPSLPPAQSTVTSPPGPTAKDDSTAGGSGKLTREQESSAMPMPGQANNHSSPAFEPARAASAASAP